MRSPAGAVPSWAAEFPISREVDQKDTLFGTEVRDPYRWLEDAKAADVQAWMKAQDELTRTKLAALPERESLVARLRELFYVDAQSAPVRRGERLFYARRSGAQEKAVVYYRDAAGAGDERVLFDPNTWPAATSLHGWSVSWDGKRVAYGVSENNSDEATLHLMEVDGAAVSTVDVIPGAKYAYASWTPAGDGFYYVRVPVDAAIPVDARPGHMELFFHRVGADPAEDALVHAKTGNPTRFLNGWLSKDGRFLFVEVAHGWRKNDLYFRDTRSGIADGWSVLVEGVDAIHDVVAHEGLFYVATNDGSPRRRIFAVDPARAAERSAWREIVAEREDATLETFAIVGGALALTYLKDVTSRLELRDLDGALLREIALPTLGRAGIGGDPDQDEAYYSFETYNYPTEIHRISVLSGARSLWFRQEAPVDSDAFVVEQLFATSKDGTRVPMFVVAAKTTPRDGTAPTYLTGYGGFNSSETPGFRKGIFPWLERGGVFVAAGLRGGGEYGEAWHRAGMKHEKERVFEDFEAVAETLVKERITSSDRLVIQGGSNGGLLVGAAITRKPEMCRVALCAVPLLDMVRYHLFGSGRTWTEEYGSAEDEADFRTLYAYSPYHHVTPGTAYPSVLFDSADADDRVDPMHARKMAALLQASSSGGPVLLRIERNAGHGGADSMRSWIERYADLYAFAIAELKKPGAAMGGT